MPERARLRTSTPNPPLVEEHDRSAQMGEFRNMLSSKSLEPSGLASRAAIEQWIKRCFSQEYKGFRV